MQTTATSSISASPGLNTMSHVASTIKATISAVPQAHRRS